MASRWKKAGAAVKIQNAAIKVLASVPHGIDGDTYFSPSIPPAVRDCVPLLSSDSVTPEIFKGVLELTTNSLVRPKSSPILIPQIESLSASSGLSFSDASALLTGLVLIISTAVRNKTKVSVVQRNLKAMNVPEEQVKAVVDSLRALRSALETAAVEHRVSAPKLSSFKWRVDVVISTDALSKVFRPTILAETTTSDGKTRTFEVPIEQFHELRYNVAKVLRNMEEVERHPIMRLAFQADREAFDKDGGKE